MPWGIELGNYAVIDPSQAPLILVSVVGEPDDESFQEYLDDIAAAFRACDRFALVFDSGELGNLPAKYRDQLSAWMKETESEFRGRWLSSAFVIKNRVIRGVLMTLFWVNPPYYETKVVSTREEGEVWCLKRLRTVGVELPKESRVSDV